MINWIYCPFILIIYHSKSMGWGKASGSDGEESACSAGDLGLIPGSGRSPGKGHGNPLQYSCLENSMDRRAWWATVHGVTKSQTWLGDWLSLLIKELIERRGNWEAGSGKSLAVQPMFFSPSWMHHGCQYSSHKFLLQGVLPTPPSSYSMGYTLEIPIPWKHHIK